jgi:CopG family transcriptional regulator/antitoxin EndoAI
MERLTSYRRVNVTLPETALRLVDRVAPRGSRSRFIAEAIKHYAAATRRKELKKRVKMGAIRRADRDRALAAEWLVIDEEIRPRKRR